MKASIAPSWFDEAISPSCNATLDPAPGANGETPLDAERGRRPQCEVLVRQHRVRRPHGESTVEK